MTVTEEASEGSVGTLERLISADSHVKVTHDQVKSHLATKFHEDYDAAVAAFTARMTRGPGAANQAGMTMKRSDQKAGQDKSIGANAVFGRPGYSNPVERLKDMDTDGIDVEVLYSEVSAFRYIPDLATGASEATRAFNDVLTEFSSPDPYRLCVSYQIPIHNIEFAVAEVERVAALGGKSLQLPVFPAEFNLPDYYDERYAPLFSTIEETGLPICCHIGLNTTLEGLSLRDPTPQKAIMVSMTPLTTAESFGMWIMAGVFERFPKLKVVFVEPGLAWVAWWLHTADDMVLRQGYEFPAITELPSTYFHRNVSLTFIEEGFSLDLLRDRIGVRNILWSTDYPHPVTSWPRSRKVVEEQFATVNDEDRELILSGNALRIWNL
jgi:predicted TIM-barrel fold metal-dependent hydrolase